jgi:hypothetical protein
VSYLSPGVPGSPIWELAYVAGPPAAGLLVGAAGVEAALAVDAASFAVMSALSFGLPDLRDQRLNTSARDRRSRNRPLVARRRAQPSGPEPQRFRACDQVSGYGQRFQEKK